MMTVKELRSRGYKVMVLHYRKPSYTQRYEQKGGTTRVIVDSPDGDHYEAEACCSKKDNYNKKLGVKIALGRCGVDAKIKTMEKV